MTRCTPLGLARAPALGAATSREAPLLRNGSWAAAIIAVLTPIWWNIASTAWSAILAHAAMTAITESAGTIAPSPPSPPLRPRQTAVPSTAVRVLGTSGSADNVTILVDLQGAEPATVAAKICADGAGFAHTALTGQTVHVLSWHGQAPATEAGSIVCP